MERGPIVNEDKNVLIKKSLQLQNETIKIMEEELNVVLSNLLLNKSYEP